VPKRTNRFQKLALWIQGQLSDDAIVTESASVLDRSTGQHAEVDILIESTMAGHQVHVGIECTSTRRRATVEWVREMIGKHQTLAIDKTVLVSESGFTREAIRRAGAAGVAAISMAEAGGRDWSRFIERALEDTQIARFNFRLVSYKVELVADEPKVPSRTNFSILSSVTSPELKEPIPLRDFVLVGLQEGITQDIMSEWVKSPASDRRSLFPCGFQFTPRPSMALQDKSGRSFSIAFVSGCLEVTVLGAAPISFRSTTFAATPVAVSNEVKRDTGSGEQSRTTIAFVCPADRSASGVVVIQDSEREVPRLYELEFTAEWSSMLSPTRSAGETSTYPGNSEIQTDEER